MTLIPNENCTQALGPNSTPSNMICAEHLEGASHICQSYTGGPLIIPESLESSNAIVIGIMISTHCTSARLTLLKYENH